MMVLQKDISILNFLDCFRPASLQHRILVVTSKIKISSTTRNGYTIIFYASLKEQKYYKKQKIQKMGGNVSGALNAQGFSHALQTNHLPDYHHITHSGIFNQNYFQVGDKAKSLLQVHHGLAISNCDLYDLPNRNYFLSLFIKSSADGQKRTRPLNVVLCLDVSGSMNASLQDAKYIEGKPVASPSRLSLARKAILMMYDKLQQNDVFSFVIFQNQATTIIKSTYVKDLSRQNVQNQVNQKFMNGGTTIAAGFNESRKNLQSFRDEHKLQNYENRIVLLTDVNDNSVASEQQLINDISNCGISTTIIGISSDFKSQTCQKLIKVKGFNYLCAVKDDDLQTYLVDQFDYTFFPCVQNTTISIKSDLIKSIEVFGSVDHDVKYTVEGNIFIVTKMQSGFPSALSYNKKGKLQTKGGLILVKFIPKELQKLPNIHLQIFVNYKDLHGKLFTQSYIIDKNIEAEQYYADQATKKGVELFYYTQTIRNLLLAMKQGDNVLSDVNKEFYLSKLDRLRQYCPHDKKEQLQKLRDIVQNK